MSGNTIWGSFERNMGTWTPYTPVENQAIEAAFQRGDASIELPTCFNAVLHFNRGMGRDDHHHQLTPAVGSKPPGYRSVLRATPGHKVLLYWWDDGAARLWRLETPPYPAQHTQEIAIPQPETAEDPGFTWQWCDLVGAAVAHAVEINWHAYAPEHGEQIEAKWTTKEQLQLVIGLTNYTIGEWNGTYGVQRNQTTGCVRQVRRGRFSIEASTPEAYQDDSCALCTEKFTDTPQWPIRRTPCNHAFHYTCLQHILRQVGRANRCPMCRASLAEMSLRSSSASSISTREESMQDHTQDRAADRRSGDMPHYYSQQDYFNDMGINPQNASMERLYYGGR